MTHQVVGVTHAIQNCEGEGTHPLEGHVVTHFAVLVFHLYIHVNRYCKVDSKLVMIFLHMTELYAKGNSVIQLKNTKYQLKNILAIKLSND